MTVVDESARRERKSLAVRLAAVGVIVVGALVGTMWGFPFVSFIRDELHIHCQMPAPGVEGAGEWACPDEISYLSTAAVFGSVWLFALVVGALIAGLARSPRMAQVGLVLLAAVAVAVNLVLTGVGSLAFVGDQHAPLSGADYWRAAVGPAALVALAGIGVALATLPSTQRLARVLPVVGAILLVLATVLQPGLGVIALLSAAILMAASLRSDEMSGNKTREAARA